jgi:hypothetical protein
MNLASSFQKQGRQRLGQHVTRRRVAPPVATRRTHLNKMRKNLSRAPGKAKYFMMPLLLTICCPDDRAAAAKTLLELQAPRSM